MTDLPSTMKWESKWGEKKQKRWKQNNDVLGSLSKKENEEEEEQDEEEKEDESEEEE